MRRRVLLPDCRSAIKVRHSVQPFDAASLTIGFTGGHEFRFPTGFRHPFLGHGPETFGVEFPREESRELARAYPDFHHESAHNIFLDAWNAQGLPGALILLAWTGMGLLSAWRARAAQPGLTGALASALAASVVCHWFSVFSATTALFFYVTIGVLASLNDGRAVAKLRFYAAVPLAAALALCGIGVLAGDRLLQRAADALSAGRFDEAEQLYTSARNGYVRADLRYSRQLVSSAQAGRDLFSSLRLWQRAIEAGHRATESDDDPANAWYHLATVSALRGDAVNTEQALRRAIAAAPNWYKPHWTLALLLQMTGRVSEARAEAANALDLNNGRSPEVAKSLASLQQ